MGNITSALIQQYQHPRIKLLVGSTTIYEDDFVSGSFAYRGGTSGGGAFAPGGCVISSVNFTVYNRSGEYSSLFYDGAIIQIYVGYGESAQTATYDKLCTVYCADVTKRNYKISVKAYDKLRDADKKKWTSYSFPMTVSQIIQSAATDAGLFIDTLPSLGADIAVDLRDDGGAQPTLSMTCRQAIAAALLISGNFGYMTPDDALYCGWYSSSADTTIDTSWLMDYSISDARSYSGVQVFGQTPTGTTDRLYVLSSNAFVTEDNCAAIQSRLYTALVGTPCYTAQIVAVCNPNLRAGMMVSMSYPHAGSMQTVTLPITSVAVRGSMKATYSSETISADEADDLREGSEKTTEDVAKGNYATKKYVDDAIADAGGGSTSMQTVQSIHTTLKEWTLTTSLTTPQYYIAEVSQDGSFTMHEIKSWGLDDQMIIVPSYDYCNHIATRAKKNLNAYVFNISARGHVEFRRDGSTSSEYVYFRFNIPRCYWTNSARITLGNPSGNYGRDTMVIAAPQWYRGWFEPTESTEEYAKGDPTYYIAPAVFGATQLRKNTTSTGGLDWDWFVPA